VETTPLLIVTHLRQIYEFSPRKLKQTARGPLGRKELEF